MLQVSSSSVRPVVVVSHPRAIARRERPRRIDLRASKPPKFQGTVASRDVGKDWPVVQQAIAGNADAQKHLFGRGTDALYRAAFSILHNKEDYGNRLSLAGTHQPSEHETVRWGPWSLRLKPLNFASTGSASIAHGRPAHSLAIRTLGQRATINRKDAPREA